MPGGAAAIRQPWRMAWSWLTEAFGEPQPLPRGLSSAVDPARWRAMASVAASAAVSPLTSSMGRLFDAVGRPMRAAGEVTYEGQAAVELEAAAWAAGPDGGRLRDRPRRPAAGDPRRRRRPAGRRRRSLVAARFHAGVAEATVAALAPTAGARGLGTAVLSGGVFQNRMLLEQVVAGATAAGLRVLVPERLPPNDGGIAFGQAAVAAARLAAGG